MIRRVKLWNEWRKRNCNNKLHKLLVLMGMVKSPTFEMHMINDKCHVADAFLDGIRRTMNEETKQ